jgi:acid phosphatase class B
MLDVTAVRLCNSAAFELFIVVQLSQLIASREKMLSIFNDFRGGCAFQSRRYRFGEPTLSPSSPSW